MDEDTEFWIGAAKRCLKIYSPKGVSFWIAKVELERFHMDISHCIEEIEAHYQLEKRKA